MFVSVVDSDGQPLMPTTPSRARRWVKSRKATPFISKGVFCVRLNEEPSARNKQIVAVGIDPGSKKEGYTVKSEAHTFLNIQADAITWVKDAIETRRNMRRGRRFRKTPCRKHRENRARDGLPPSTKARWQWKLRISKWLTKLFPVCCFVVEDICAKSKIGKRRWNKSFSPLQVGKQRFYAELRKLGSVELKQGWETAEIRTALGLKKSSKKMAEVFEAHCVDSWALAHWFTGGADFVDNKSLLFISPIRLHRRQLHMMQFAQNGLRKRYGGTRSLGLKRGALVKSEKFGLTYVGGHTEKAVSLHCVKTGRRLTKHGKSASLKMLAFNTWKRRSFAVA